MQDKNEIIQNNFKFVERKNTDVGCFEWNLRKKNIIIFGQERC